MIFAQLFVNITMEHFETLMSDRGGNDINYLRYFFINITAVILTSEYSAVGHRVPVSNLTQI